MRLNFFAIYKKKIKQKKIQTLQNHIPHFNGRCSHSLSLLLLLTSCRTSACLFLLHQGPLPPPVSLSVLAKTWPLLLLIVHVTVLM